MYKVRDLVYDNRWATMKDGTVYKFLKQECDVADAHIEYFQRISDFQVGRHTLPAAIEVKPKVEPTPAQVQAQKRADEKLGEPVYTDVTPIVETEKETVEETEKKAFNKVLPKKK